MKAACFGQTNSPFDLFNSFFFPARQTHLPDFAVKYSFLSFLLSMSPLDYPRTKCNSPAQQKLVKASRERPSGDAPTPVSQSEKTVLIIIGSYSADYMRSLPCRCSNCKSHSCCSRRRCCCFMHRCFPLDGGADNEPLTGAFNKNGGENKTASADVGKINLAGLRR